MSEMSSQDQTDLAAMYDEEWRYAEPKMPTRRTVGDHWVLAPAPAQPVRCRCIVGVDHAPLHKVILERFGDGRPVLQSCWCAIGHDHERRES